MSKRFFDYDPLTGTTEWFEATDDGFRIYTEMDAAPILDLNAHKRSMGREYYAADKDFWRVASVPNIMLIKWATDMGVPVDKVYSDEFAEIITRKLNDSEFRNLKTADVRI